MPTDPDRTANSTPSSSVRLKACPDGIAMLTIDQPNSRANVLSRQLWAELGAVVADLKGRGELRGLLVGSGKPGMFIAGADLNELASASVEDPRPTRTFIEQGLAVLADLESLPFPTAALVDGFCLGGGLEVALACDHRLAGSHPKAIFGLPEITLGLIPGWGGTQRLPRLIGVDETLRMILNNVQYGADEAHERGLVAEVASSDQLLEAGAQLVRRDAESGHWPQERERKRRPIAERPPLPVTAERLSEGIASAVAEPEFLGPELFEGMRRYVNQTMAESPSRRASLEAIDVVEAGLRLPLHAGIERETEAFVRLAGTPESRQLIAGFFASRKKG